MKPRQNTLRLAFFFALAALPLLLEALDPNLSPAPQRQAESAAEAAPKTKQLPGFYEQNQQIPQDLELLRFELSPRLLASHWRSVAKDAAPEKAPCTASAHELMLCCALPPGTGPPRSRQARGGRSPRDKKKPGEHEPAPRSSALLFTSPGFG